MKLKISSTALALMSALSTANAEANGDSLAPWRTGVRIHSVAPETARHSIHSYFNTCPESPDGKRVLYYTSTTPEGEAGEIRIRERDSGKETISRRTLRPRTPTARPASNGSTAARPSSIMTAVLDDGAW